MHMQIKKKKKNPIQIEATLGIADGGAIKARNDGMRFY